MGISLIEAAALFSLCKFDRVGDDILCFGRQANYVRENQLCRLVAGFGLNWSRTEIGRISGATYAEPMLKRLGFETIRSLDFSAYEEAQIIHDLNQPIPVALEGSAGFIYAGGSIEHVFDVARVLDNIVRLLRLGGSVLITAPANGAVGHGFYQFSPELFYRFFDANGFENTRCYIAVRGFPQRWFRVPDPKLVGRRIEFLTTEPAELLIISTKAAQLARQVVPQQSDYAQAWTQSVHEMDALNTHRHGVRVSRVTKIFKRIQLSRDIVLRHVFGYGMPELAGHPFFERVEPFGKF